MATTEDLSTSKDSFFDDDDIKEVSGALPVATPAGKAPMEDSAKDGPDVRPKKKPEYSEADIDAALESDGSLEIDHEEADASPVKDNTVKSSTSSAAPTTTATGKLEDTASATEAPRGSMADRMSAAAPESPTSAPTPNTNLDRVPVVSTSPSSPSSTAFAQPTVTSLPAAVAAPSSSSVEHVPIKEQEKPLDPPAYSLLTRDYSLASGWDDSMGEEEHDKALAKELSLPPPLPSETVDFSASPSGQKAQGSQQEGTSSLSLIVPSSPGELIDLGPQKSADPKAAAARFKEMEERHQRAKHKAPDSPSVAMVTMEDVQKAGLETKTGLSDLPSPLQLFLQYDADRTGGINRKEFGQMLYDLDSLANTHKKKRDEYILAQFELADLNSDDLISIDEFYLYYYSTLCFKFPVLLSGQNPGADLLNIYMKYASLGKQVRCEELGSYPFTKLCVDCKLVNGKTVTRATCDIIWFRARAELENLQAWKRKNFENITPKMLYPQFLFALMRLAAKRKSGFQEVVCRILQTVSPLPPAQSSDYLILKNNGSDDQKYEFLERPRGLPKPLRDTSAMVRRMEQEALMSKSVMAPKANKPHATAQKSDEYSDEFFGDDPFKGAGGSKAGSQKSATGTISSMRSKSTLPEGFRRAGMMPPDLPGRDAVLPDYSETLVPQSTLSTWGLQETILTTIPLRGPRALSDPESLLAVRNLDPRDLVAGLRAAFEKYNLWEQGTNKSQMDKTRFNKVLRDAQLVSEHPGGLNSKTVDKFFFKVLPPASESINFVRFVDALRLVSTKLRYSLNRVVEAIVLVGAPVGA